MKKCCIVLFLVIGLLSPTLSQVEEHFSDGNITHDPIWVGMTDLFEVVNMDSLHLRDSVAGFAFITTSSSAINWASWEILLNMQFNPSASNYVRIYLVADNANLDSSLAGYYVLVGGSNDEVSLFRQDGQSHFPVVQGAEDRVDTAMVRITIRVTRDELGNWELLTQPEGTGDFLAEGSAFDDVHIQSSYFGIFCQYTKTRSDKFFFDRVVVTGDPYTDLESPKLASFEILSDRSIVLEFSEAVKPGWAFNSKNYLLLPQASQPTMVGMPDSITVEIQFDQPFINGANQQLVISGLEDLNHNITLTDTLNFIYFKPSTPILRDIIITEIQFDPVPSQGLPESEFIEIFNASQKTFNLHNWTLADEITSGSIDSLLFFPGDYAILCPREDFPFFSQLGLTAATAPWPSLNNSGDLIRLISPNQELVDSVEYQSSWHQDQKANGGYSLELFHWSNDCPPQFNWGSSTSLEGGTPGQQNSASDNDSILWPSESWEVTVLDNDLLGLDTGKPLSNASINPQSFSVQPEGAVAQIILDSFYQSRIELKLASPLDTGIIYTLSLDNLFDCRGTSLPQVLLEFGIPARPSTNDLIFTEVMADPAPSLGSLPEVEYIEIWNASPKVLDLCEVYLTDLKDTSQLNTHWLPPSDYLVLTSSSGADQFDSSIHLGTLDKWIGLNQNATVILFDDRNLIIDRLTYQRDWLGQNQAGGYSLEMRDPFFQCEPEVNWTASVSEKGGTPGRPNSVADSVPARPTTLTDQELVSLDTLLLIFDSWIDTAFNSSFLLEASPSIPVLKVMALSRDSLWVVFGKPVDPAILYRLEIDSLRSCPGHLIPKFTTHFGEGIVPKRNQLLITEIMADPVPSQGLPEVEYVELFNPTDSLISLDGVAFRDTKDSVQLGIGTIAPFEYLVLCPANQAFEFEPYGRVLGVSPWLGLNNTGDDLKLARGQQLIFDVSYSRTWYDDFAKDEGGFSLEMIDPETPCGGEMNWDASLSLVGGTPGQENSTKASRVDHRGPNVEQIRPTTDTSLVIEMSEKLNPWSIHPADFRLDPPYDGEIRISENGNKVALEFTIGLARGVWYDLEIKNITDCAGNLIEPSPSYHRFIIPEAAVEGDIKLSEVLYDPEPGSVDFVELYNSSGKHINVEEWALSNSLESPGIELASTTIPMVIPPFSFLVFSSDLESLEKYPTSDPQVFVKKGIPNFPNREGSVVLYGPDKKVYDHLAYSEDQHFALLRETEGVSLERVSFEIGTNEPQNWQSALGDVGWATPGRVNSQSNPHDRLEDVIEISPKVLAPGMGNLVSISYQFTQPGNVGSLSIFDAAGRKIKTIARNQTLSSSGFMIWDGTTDNRYPAPIGLYVIYFEWFNLSGETESRKKTVVVGSN